MDFLSSLGNLAFGSRLKRLVKRTDADISRVYQGLGIDFEARWFPILILLTRNKQLSITEIAAALRFSHTAVNKFAAAMIKQGLLTSSADAKDRRRRLLRLSKKGRDTISQLRPIWEDIRIVTEELVAASDPSILAAANAIERELDRKGVYDRVRERLKPRLLKQIEIIDYAARYKRHFADLNRAWLEEYFKVEKADEKILSDPYREIIRPGGVVLFARLDRRIVGTGALIRHSEDIWELAKMAVHADFRRRYVGLRLAEALMERARKLGAAVLYLETSRKQKPALRLYENLGFAVTDERPFPQKYRRRRIIMKYQFNPEE
jgi:DNA-binding MarR family transcriptional regulator